MCAKQTRTENKRHLDPVRWHSIIVERYARDDRLQGSNILRLVLYVHASCEILSKVGLVKIKIVCLRYV